MARVFLSYDREDLERAKPLAAALSSAGHSVWWDREIAGGTQFGKEIEQALSDSDAIVVLWSERSVESAWVRDEAAAGRDTNRLVPALLDTAKPPLGFRQYQAVDLSRWNGRRRASEFQQLVRAIDRLTAGGARKEPGLAKTAERHQQRPSARLLVAIAAVAVALLGGAFFWWQSTSGASATPVVAVAPATPDAAARLLARDLLVQLGSIRAAETGALQLTDDRSRKSATLTFEVAGNTDQQQPTANLVLFSSANRELLWSQDFKPESGKPADLNQQMGYTAARVLGCALEGLSADDRRLKVETLKIYLSGCSSLAMLNAGEFREGIPKFREVLARTPQFAGAWGKLITAESEVFVSESFGASTDEIAEMRSQLMRDINKARRVSPNLPEAYQAEIDLLPVNAYAERLRLAEKAVETNPESSLGFGARSRILQSVGRVNDSVADARRAKELDPVSPIWRNNYILVLAYAGLMETALQELADAERLWPDTSSIAAARFGLDLRYGDPRRALEYIRSGATGGGWLRSMSYLDARQDPRPSKIDLAIGDAAALYRQNPDYLAHTAQVFGTFDQEDRLLASLLRVPKSHLIQVMDVLFRAGVAEIWHDPRSLQLAARTGILDYWRRAGTWPDFCSDPNLPYDCKVEVAKYPS